MNILKKITGITLVTVSMTASTVHAGQNSGAGHSADIVDIAASAGSFQTLVAAVKAADLVGTLKGAGPYTVFAPTDKAFAKLPAGTVENLLKPENKQQLVEILTYHVVPGRIMSRDIAGQNASVATVQGQKIRVDATHGVKINQANVIQADIAASNGVIHVIDQVILPGAESPAAGAHMIDGYDLSSDHDRWAYYGYMASYGR